MEGTASDIAIRIEQETRKEGLTMQRRADDGQEPTAPHHVEQHSQELFDEAVRLVGDRFAEARFDPDRGLRVTVIDLTDQDVAAIDGVAQQLGITDWVRTERADPAALENWGRLRHDLRGLQDSRPSVLQEYPSPEPGYRRPPVEIDLAAFAESTAAELHNTYGGFVSLRVGALPYPPRPDLPSPSQSTPRGLERGTVNPGEMRVVLDGPLSVASGHTATHALLVTNVSGHDSRVHTNGVLTAVIIDAGTRAVVGGYAGAQHQPSVIFTAAPSETVRIPLLVGTASYTPQVGYAIPAGSWHLIVPMDLGDGRRVATPALELTITR